MVFIDKIAKAIDCCFELLYDFVLVKNCLISGVFKAAFVLVRIGFDN